MPPHPQGVSRLADFPVVGDAESGAVRTYPTRRLGRGPGHTGAPAGADCCACEGRPGVRVRVCCAGRYADQHASSRTQPSEPVDDSERRLPDGLGTGPRSRAPTCKNDLREKQILQSCRFKIQIADSGHPRHNLLRRRRSEKRNRHPTRPLEASCGFVPGRCSTLDGDTGRWPPPARIACAAKAIRSVASGRGQRFHHRVARHATGPRESSTYGPIVSTLGHSPAPRRAAGRLNRLGEARRALQPSAPAPHGRLVSGAAI